MPLRKHVPQPKSLPAPTPPAGKDLVSLPTRKPSEDEPLDPEIVRTCLWHAKGNIHAAAKLVRCSTARLGIFLKNNPTLAEERARAAELLLDKAESVLDGLLEDDDRQEDTAKWLLTNAGKARGYGRDAPTPMGFSFGPSSPGSGQIAIRWEVDK